MSSCYVTGCPGFGQWQMGLQVWPTGADKQTDAPETIALGLTCCETHRLDKQDATTILPPAAQSLANASRAAEGHTALDFASARIVFREYLINGGEWHL